MLSGSIKANLDGEIISFIGRVAASRSHQEGVGPFQIKADTRITRIGDWIEGKLGDVFAALQDEAED